MRKLSVRHTPRRAAAWSGGSNRSGGFTLLETLLTVAILVILLGLSMVGVARYRDHLKITELDNAARDIYMAAENRAVLLQNSGQLGGGSTTLLSSISGANPGDPVMLSNTTPDATLNELLPMGCIDPSLRKEHFRVLYDKDTGHVIEVFYAEGQIDNTKLNNFRQTRSKRVSEFRNGTTECLVGHYQSDAADAIGTKPLATPGVEVLITNGNELTLTVKYTLPAEVDASITRTPIVTLKYGAEEVVLLSDTVLVNGGRLIVGSSLDDLKNAAPGTSATYTWVLDSLDTSKQFKELTGSSVALGDDFTVTAGLTLTAPGYIDSAYYATGEDNSLFAKGSTYDFDDDGNGTGTAQIANLRHLQNLHPGHSNAGPGAVNAVQLCDIDCEKALDNSGNVLKDSAGNTLAGADQYKFVPIVNSSLTSYNGKNGDKNTHIFNLSTIETAADAGLFGAVDHDLTIENCRVCWSKPENLVKDTDSDSKADIYVYAVSGTTNAGGLIGCVSGGNVTIKNSFAATTVSGTGAAGGLVGSVSGGTLNINNSYADCYLTGGSVGGLVGSGTVAKLDYCYAAGFIVNPTTNTNTAGLVNGSVTNASNTYSVVRTIGGSMGYPKKPLYDGVDYIVSDDVRYLNDTSTAFNPDPGVFTHAGTSETHVYDLRYRLSNEDGDKLVPPTYPFRGLKDTEGRAIPHYGDWCSVLPAVIRGMVYYEEYYHENTPTNAYGFPNDSYYVGAAGKFVVTGTNGKAEYSPFNIYPLRDDFGNTDTAKNNPVVVRDGYALLFMGGSVSLGKYEVEYGGTQKWTLQNTPEGLMWTCEWTEEKYNQKYGEKPADEPARSFTLPRDTAKEPPACKDLPEENYVLVLLPDAVVTGNFAYGVNFYQKLTATKVGDAAEAPANFYFNPLFAKTVETEDKTAALTDAANPVKVSIRTARHLYDLSRLYDTRHLYNDPDARESDADFIKNLNSYISNNYYNKGYTFLQELDIDYAKYTWYGDKPDQGPGSYRVQHPIGVGVSGQTGSENMALNQAFCGTYDGGCHIIRNVVFKETGYYLGLFGMTEKWGPTEAKKTPVLKNIVYEMDPATTVTLTTPASMYHTDTGVWDAIRSIGALVGKNDGLMDNCAVYGVNMEVTGKYTGGLLGYNQATVQNCAAEVASLTVTLYSEVDTEIPCASGLVGKQNEDICKITNSYAVGKLVCVGSQNTKTGQAIAGLVAHKGIVSNCYAAVDLVTDNADVERYGLCMYGVTTNSEGNTVLISGSTSSVSNSCWLKDAFVYRGVKYSTAMATYKDKDNGILLKNLAIPPLEKVATGNTVKNIPGGATYANVYAGDFPYLTGVTSTMTRNADRTIKSKDNTNYQPIHYGLWPTPLTAGLAYYEVYQVGTKQGTQGGTTVTVPVYDYAIAGTYEDQMPDNLKTNNQLETNSFYAGKYANDPTFVKSSSASVVRDGYALVFDVTESDVPVGDYKIEYGNTTTNTKKFTLTKDTNGKWYYWSGSNKYEYPSYTTTVDSVTYALVPLPNSVITGTLSEGDVSSAKFYQKLVFGPDMYATRTFYFNPHFARTVKAGTMDYAGVGYKAPGVPAEPVHNQTSNPPVWAVMCWEIDKQWTEDGKGIIAVRTPRHFYALSHFQSSYASKDKLHYFKQELDLDYGTYEWYGDSTKDENPTSQNGGAYYTQDPIGRAWRPATDKDWNHDDGFKGAYNGGGHTIRNVFYNVTPIESSSSQYMGLFRYVEYLWDITYEVPDNITVTLKNDGTYPSAANVNDRIIPLRNGVKVGTLMGGNFRAWNCHAIVNNLTVDVAGGYHAYVGGLAGFNNKAQDCSVIITGCLTVKGRTEDFHVGGMQGIVYQEMLNCTSKVNSIVVEGETNSTYFVGGLAGSVVANFAEGARIVSGCAVEVKDLRITGTTVKKGYAGGLIGCNNYGGHIYSSYAIGAIGAGQTAANSIYAGFAGGNSDGTHNKVGDPTAKYPFEIKNCYSAVGLPDKATSYNFCPDVTGTIENCYYLGGKWTYNNGEHTAVTASTSQGQGITYTDLQKFESQGFSYDFAYNGYGTARTFSYSIPAMQTVDGSGYPFPVGTRHLAKDENGNVKYDSGTGKPTYSAYYYPGSGSDWPQPIASSASLLSDEPEAESAVASADLALPPEPQELLPEPEELLPEPEALPPEPEELPEPEEQDDEPEPESGDENEPTD